MSASRFIIAILLAALMLLPSRFCCALTVASEDSNESQTIQLSCCSGATDTDNSSDEDAAPGRKHSSRSCGCCNDAVLAARSLSLDLDGVAPLDVSHPLPVAFMADVAFARWTLNLAPHRAACPQVLFCRWIC